MDTTIKVDSRVRDRLARLARERDTTIRELVSQLAAAELTEEELRARAQAANAHVREHINPDLSDGDLAAAEHFWTEVEAGRLPEIGAAHHRPA